jgi:hypothetical protein
MVRVVGADPFTVTVASSVTNPSFLTVKIAVPAFGAGIRKPPMAVIPRRTDPTQTSAPAGSVTIRMSPASAEAAKPRQKTTIESFAISRPFIGCREREYTFAIRVLRNAPVESAGRKWCAPGRFERPTCRFVGEVE